MSKKTLLILKKIDKTKSAKKTRKMNLAIGQLEKKLLLCVERFEAFEEKLGVSIQNVSVRIDAERKWLTIFCEVYSNDGTNIREYVTIETVLYNNEGLILDQSHTIIGPDKFFGFEVIKEEFREFGIADVVSKIRIYPKKF